MQCKVFAPASKHLLRLNGARIGGGIMKDTTTRTYFIAQCCNKYVYEWVAPQFTSYMWYDTPTKFNTKEKCLQAVGSAMRNSEKPNERVVIKELRETIITDVINEEIL